MAAYLILSVLAGTISALVGVFAFDAGFLATTVWYIAGCWAGFAVSLITVLAVIFARKPDQTETRTAFG